MSSSSPERLPREIVKRLRRAHAEEIASLHLVLRMMRWVTLLVPRDTGFRLRTLLIRAAGWNVDRSTMFACAPSWTGQGAIVPRLSVGADCWINSGCHLELNDDIRIGKRVAIGHDVLIMTSTHKVGTSGRRAGPTTTARVTIESGAWIGARSTILPGVTIGAGSIVSAGSVVNADVPANSVVAGTPATVVVPRLPG